MLTRPAARTPAVGRAPVQLLMAASATSSFDRFVTGPVLLSLAAGLSVSLGSAAAAASWYYLLYGLGQPVWGLLSDRFGRVRTMRAALTVAALAGGCAVVAPTFGALVVARAVTGAAMGAVVPTCLVYVGDAVPLDRRQHTLTDLNAATATGITFATALGGVLAATVSWRAAFAVPAVGAALVALLLRRLPEPTRPVVAQTGVLTVLRHRWGRRVLALTLVEGAVLLGLLAYLAPALQSTGESATTAGLVVALYGVGLLLASRVVKRRVARTAPRVLLGVGAALLVAAYAVTAVSRSELAVGATALLVGFGWAPLHSTMQTWATEVVPQARAAMVSLFAAMLFLGGGLATAVLAPFAGQQRWTPMFAVAALVTAGFGVVAVLVRGRYHRPAVS